MSPLSFAGTVSTALHGVTSAPAVLRSGILAPVGPAGLARMIGAWRNWHASPATVCAIAAARWPDRLAIADDRGELTYAELDDRSGKLATGMAVECGIGPGTAVAVMCRNHRGFVEAVIAAGRLGADLVLLNTGLGAEALAKVLQRQRIGAVVCDEEFAGTFDAAGQHGPRIIAWHDAQAALSVDGLVARANGTPPKPGRPGKVVLLTSGTTGVPKGVPRTPSAWDMLGVGLSAIERVSLRTNESMLIAPPLFHGFGMAFFAIALAMGDTMVLRRSFDAEDALAAIERHRVTIMLGVPVMLQRMTGLDDEVKGRYDTSSLRVAFSGASALSPALAGRVAADFGDIVYDGYGSSEVGIATIATPADLARAPGTVGKPVGGVEVAVVDRDGRKVPAGEIGQIVVGSALTFEGYSGGGNKDLVDGLMSTGDLGHFDGDDRLFVDGRADDMIVSGGENVFPQEVEDALSTHGAVAENAVIGVDDPEFGQRLKAFVVLRDRHRATADDLKRHLRTKLARFMVPREFVFLDALPRNATGKILRSGLGEQS